MNTDILLSLKQIALPSDFHVAPDLAKYVKTYKQYLPDATRSFDLEDFFEDAFRLYYALQYFENVYVFNNDEMLRVHVKNVRTGEVFHKDDIPHPIVLGALQSQEDQITTSAVDRYMFTRTFMERAGRKTRLLPLLEDLDHEVADFESEELFIKAIKSKQGIWITGKTDVYDTLYDVLEWEAVNLLETGAPLLFQEKIEMYYEMRCFVVDGELVTSAGCIENFTPINNHDQFDFQLARVRNVSSPEERVHVRNVLQDFAHAVIHDFVVETGIKNFVVDVAVDNHNNPLVVEFNRLGSSGLYASSPKHMLRALHHAVDCSGVDNHDWAVEPRHAVKRISS